MLAEEGPEGSLEDFGGGRGLATTRGVRISP